jgi:ubiquinone/menaquinone biosynthesis C-methylase UbiE
MAAALGLQATGVDLAPSAIAIAQGKARQRGLAARFLVGDALRLEALGERFETVLDCGLFHLFEDDERVRFVEGLRVVVPPGGRYHLLCFSDRVPGTLGPRRVSQEEIRASFGEGWRVDAIEEARIETTVIPAAVPAWLATITRT